MSDWINVNDGLPNDGDEVLIYTPDNDKSMDYENLLCGNISIGYIKNGIFFDLIDFTMSPAYVTHWMKKPPNPFAGIIQIRKIS